MVTMILNLIQVDAGLGEVVLCPLDKVDRLPVDPGRLVTREGLQPHKAVNGIVSPTAGAPAGS